MVLTELLNFPRGNTLDELLNFPGYSTLSISDRSSIRCSLEPFFLDMPTDAVLLKKFKDNSVFATEQEPMMWIVKDEEGEKLYIIADELVVKENELIFLKDSKQIACF